MRGLTFAFVFAACASTPKSPHVLVDPPKALDTVAPVAVSAAPDLDAASLKAKSRAFLDAVDHFDKSTVGDALSPAFVRFAAQRFIDGPLFLQFLDGYVANHAPVRSRTYAEEKTYAGGNAAIYIGHDTRHIPSDGDHAAVDDEGWDTLIWVRDGDRWKLAHWQWAPAGIEAERREWDDTFKLSTNFNLKPNQLLVDTVKGRKPGTALDIAMGQGRNAVFLATAGWKVTGVDISEEGMRIAREAAAAKKVKLETVSADMAAYDPGKDRWDLITLIYAGDDHAVIEKAKLGLKRGGLFVSEFFAKDATRGSGIGGFAPGELAALFKDGFKILVDTEVEDVADWGLQKTKVARFVAQKL
jgi:SAM-dependent methyltransferase